MNLCRCCNEDFGSVAAFDKHWVGRLSNREPCMGIPEMKARGFRRNKRGAWSVSSYLSE